MISIASRRYNSASLRHKPERSANSCQTRRTDNTLLDNRPSAETLGNRSHSGFSKPLGAVTAEVDRPLQNGARSQIRHDSYAFAGTRHRAEPEPDVRRLTCCKSIRTRPSLREQEQKWANAFRPNGQLTIRSPTRLRGSDGSSLSKGH